LARQPDEVSIEHVEHRRAGDAHDPGRDEPAERHCRQDEMSEAAAPASRQQLPAHADEFDQEDGEPEIGHRLPENREQLAARVEHRVAPRRRQHTDRDSD
jgi:hypothetical protein